MQNKTKKTLAIVLGSIGGAGLITGTGLLIAGLLKKAPIQDNRITITFDLGSDVEVQGSRIIKLEAETTFGKLNKPAVFKNGYMFAGWYLDNQFTQPVGDDDTVNSSKTYYAKFSEDTTLFIDFSKGDTGATIYGNTRVAIQRGAEFSTINKPTAVLNNHIFQSWVNGTQDVTEDTIISDVATLRPRFENPYAEKAHVIYKTKSEDPKATITGLFEYDVAVGTVFKKCTKPIAEKPGSVFNDWVKKDGDNYVPFEPGETLKAGITTVYADFSVVDQDEKITITDKDGKSRWLKNPSDISGQLIFVDKDGNELPFDRDGDNGFNETITIGSKMTAIDVDFLYGCTKFNNGDKTLTIPHNIKTIADSFLHGCSSFNQQISFDDGSSEPISLTSIGSSFLQNCASFNQKITLPDTVTSIGSYFLYECRTFNSSVTLSNSLTRIRGSFMEGCVEFNQSLTIPDSVKVIDPYFLGRCIKFNQSMVVPSTVDEIGADFMFACMAFNNSITLPKDNTNFKTIPDSFMEYCKNFNTSFKIPDSITKISDYFLCECSSFNQSLTIPTNTTSIGTWFLSQCTSFNQNIKIPSAVTKIGINFMENVSNMVSTVTFDNSAPGIEKVPEGSERGDFTLACGNKDFACYETGITIDGNGRTWILDNFENTPEATTPPYRNLK